jgi:L-threonylcarbamoyladenylate synthase
MMPIDTSELLKARDRLVAGDVVAIPTETVYGLAASIDSEKGLRRIFSLKERPFFDPLIVHVASLKEASSLVRDWPPIADFIGRYFWPGPLTLVLPKAERVNSLITSGLDTVAVRYPSHPLTLDLIRLVGTPLAAPSANKFGKTSPSRALHVKSEFPGTDLLILDGGECEIGVE